MEIGFGGTFTGVGEGVRPSADTGSIGWTIGAGGCGSMGPESASKSSENRSIEISVKTGEWVDGGR